MPRNEYDDRPRSRRRAWDDYDPEDDYDDRPRARRERDPRPQVNVLGVLSLGIGVLALAMSFGCGGSPSSRG